MGWRTYLLISFLSRRLTSKLFLNSPEAAETTFSALSPFRRTFKHFNFLLVLFLLCLVFTTGVWHSPLPWANFDLPLNCSIRQRTPDKTAPQIQMEKTETVFSNPSGSCSPGGRQSGWKVSQCWRSRVRDPEERVALGY